MSKPWLKPSLPLLLGAFAVYCLGYLFGFCRGLAVGWKLGFFG
jgi:hypothetical protein